MTAPPPIERPMTAGQWAKRWKVTRKTARAWLRDLHERFGERAVTRYGKQGSYRASQAQLERVARDPEPGVVSQTEFVRAMGEVWQAIDSLRQNSTRTG